ncbi:hypothetical protein EDF56_1011044 [Novosphingobium sp. PhB165]|nr:hypothetical protein EDF56_1011044 [Novosphingobium sp. PhB165]
MEEGAGSECKDDHAGMALVVAALVLMFNAGFKHGD